MESVPIVCQHCGDKILEYLVLVIMGEEENAKVVIQIFH